MTDKDIAIKVENLSKVYKLYDKPIDRLKESLHFRGKKYHKDFYALNDVSFEIKKGETVGIIGKNGSGKSTLLKIITGVLTPSSGNVMVNGKVSALLELGAGFNPEYTGLENVYLQGGIMGYERHEIDNKLPNILEFADIGEFINQPFKTYSSGMSARLAFAVSINVEPDILIVDEALSVGDELFQRKCYKKFEEIQAKGATILFVTHSTGIVEKICSSGIVLNNGCIRYLGVAKNSIEEYRNILYNVKKNESYTNYIERNILSFNPNQEKFLVNQQNYDLNNNVQPFIKHIYIYNTVNDINFEIGSKIVFEVIVNDPVGQKNLQSGMRIKTMEGLEVFGASSYGKNKNFFTETPSLVKFCFSLDLRLNVGTYFVTFALAESLDNSGLNIKYLDKKEDVVYFKVDNTNFNQQCDGIVVMDYNIESTKL